MPARRVTIYDIARALGVSTGTVNRALNDKPDVSESTRRLVLDKAREMGFTFNLAAKNLARRHVRLAFVIHNLVPVFHDELTRGASDAGRELESMNASVEIVTIRGVDVRDEFLSKLRDLAADGFDGTVAVPPPDTGGYPEAITELSRRGFRTAFVNCDLPDGCGFAFTLRKNALLAGRMAAELLSRMVPNGRAAIFTGRRGVADHEEAVEGFRAEAARRGLTLLDVCEHRDDPELAAGKVPLLLREHPDVDCVYFNTAASCGACRALSSLVPRGSVKIVASDLFPELEALMCEDIIQATIFQNPYRQGYDAVKRLYAAVSENACDGERILVAPRAVLQCEI